MQKRMSHSIFGVIVLLLSLGHWPFTVHAEEAKACDPEPTDMKIQSGDSFSCEISPGGDTDIFRFEANAGEKIIIRIADLSDGHGYSHMQPCIELLDTNGATTENGGNVCTSDGGTKEISETIQVPGTHTIIVREDDGDYVDYGISLQCVFGTCATAYFTTTPSTGEAPLTVELDASLSTGNITNYAWSSSDGQSTLGKITSLTFNNREETYTITLTATYEDGTIQSVSRRVTVENPNQPPKANFTATPDRGTVPLTVNLDASPSQDSDGSIVSYEWLVNGETLSNTKMATTTFDIADSHTITLTVTDNEDATDKRSRTIIVEPTGQVADVGQAIVIAASGAQPSNTLFPYSNDFAQRMYRLLKERGFKDENILYMSPRAPDIDLDGYLDNASQDYDLRDPMPQLEAAFAEAAARLQAGQQFVFFLHGHGRPDQLEIDRQHKLSAQQFNELLKTLPAGIEQIIILGSCYSGSFLNDLMTNPAPIKRIVLTSSDDNSLAWIVDKSSFSGKLIRLLRKGMNLNEGFLATTEMIEENPDIFGNQEPWLDDNGDGQYTPDQDGSVAAEVYLGKPGVSAAASPEIIEVHPAVTLNGDSAKATLWVKVTPTPDFIHKVRAVLIRPDLPVFAYEGEGTDFWHQELAFQYNADKGRYEHSYERFCTSGTWRVMYQVQDTDGRWSDVNFGEVQQAEEIKASICRLPITVNMRLNQARYTAGETLRLDMQVDGDGTADLYLAIVFPDGTFATLNSTTGFSSLNAIIPYRSDVAISGKRDYPIFDIQLQAGFATGDYSACGVLMPPTGNALDAANWIHFHCQKVNFY